jgi:hypothetical protein
METNVSTNNKRANSIIKNSVSHAQVIQQNSQTSSDPYIAFKTHRHMISRLLHLWRWQCRGWQIRECKTATETNIEIANAAYFT